MEEARPLSAAVQGALGGIEPPSIPPIDPEAPATRSLLRAAVDEAVALLRADGGLVYLLDEGGTTLRMLEDTGVTDHPERAWARGLEIPLGAGMFGKSVDEGRVVATGDYAADQGFRHLPETDRVAEQAGMVSMVVAPLAARYAVLGAIAVFSRRPDAFGEADIALVRSLAGHAAATLASEALVTALGSTAAQLARRSERERTLRELVGSLAAVRDPDELLRRVLSAVMTVTGARGALVDRMDTAGHHRHVYLTRTDSGIVEDVLSEPAHPNAGMMGRAMIERRVVETGDYMADDAFNHTDEFDGNARRLNIRSLVAVPLIVDDEPQGVLAAHSDRVDAFGEEAVEMMTAFADHAAVAIANARRLEELSRSRSDLARRAAEERALREIAASLALIRDPDDVLAQAVEAACRLVGGEWAEIARVTPTGTLLTTHVHGLDDPETRAFQAAHELPVGQGIMGRAAALGRTLITGDYLADDSFAHLPVNDASAQQVGIRSMIAAPLTTGEDGVIGILAVHSAKPDAFDPARIPLVDAFASIAAAAMGNARLIEALDRSETRYRDLLAASPDIVFTVDEAGSFTYLSDTLERQLGWRVDEISGRHFSAIIDTGSMGSARERWRQLQETPGVVLNARFDLVHRDGRRIPYEIRSSGLAVEGRFIGVMGAARDISDRDRLERELRASERDLRESEAKYRYLVDNSPDIVWSADAAGILTYMSETCEEVLGWRPDEVVGHHFAKVVHPSSLGFVQEHYAASLAGAPERELRYRFNGNHKDGSKVPLEMHARTILVDGVYAGTHGACRDIRERDRLERDLSRQAAELAASQERAHLARELHDSVTQALFSMTLVTKSIDLLLDSDPPTARARLQTLAELQADALAEMRALIFELRPASLETAGLAGALRTHCAALQGRTGLAIVLEAEVERLPGDVEAAVFRVAQEALNNVVKHAAARQVRVAVAADAGRAVLEVADDGAGFDPSQVADGHLGLAGMRARAEKLGGTLAVTSARGRGTKVRMEVPLGPESGEPREPVRSAEAAARG